MSTNDQDQLEFAAFVGIDWADHQHAWALRKIGSSATEEGQMDHTPEAVEQWAVELQWITVAGFSKFSALPS